MDAKKIAIYTISGVIAIGLGVLCFFGAKNIVNNMQQSASNDVSSTYQDARYRYESAVLAKEQEEQNVDTEQSDENTTPNNPTGNLVIEIIGDDTNNQNGANPNDLPDDKVSSDNNSTTTPEADNTADILSHLVLTENGTYVYHIQAGDTLSEISAKLFYSVDELALYNQIKNVHLIYEGSVIRIPVNQDE